MGRKLKMLQKEEIINILKKLKQELKDEYKVKKLGIFGSFIKDEQHEDSDIDILVEFEKEADLFDFTGLGIYLEEKLNSHVDLIPKNAIKKELKDEIMEHVFFI
ncbi:MAG: nucleotidyltransferase family protein [Promethearchaeia archaeon]